MRVVAILRDHLGDAVNHTAALACLRRAWPGAWIAGEAGPLAAELLSGEGLLDEIVVRPLHGGLPGKIASVRRLRAGRFERAVVLDDSREHARRARLARIPWVAGIVRKSPGLYDVGVPLRRDRHELLDPSRDLLEAIGVPTTGYRPHLTVAVERDPHAVLLAPECSHPSREWPLEHFVALAWMLGREGRRVGVVGRDPEKRSALTGVGAEAWGGDGSVRDLVRAVARAGALVCGDTGPMHVAAAVGTPCVALYGPSDPVYTRPWGDATAIVHTDTRRVEDIEPSAIRDLLLSGRIRNDPAAG